MKSKTPKPIEERKRHNLSLALEYAEVGLPVVPCEDRSKRDTKGRLIGKPLAAWKRGATTDSKTIKAWWRKYPHAVPGIPTGEASGLAVLDLDRKDGKDGLSAIKEWGFDPDTSPAPVVDTPSGGVHLIFKHRSGLGSSNSHLPLGVDVKAEGGIIIPPGAWDARGRYEARSGDFLIDVELGLPEWPAALVPPEREEPTGKPVNIDMVASAPADRRETAREWFKADCDAYAHMEAGEPGGRHLGLFKLACRGGSYGAAGLLGRAEINDMVAEAAAENGYLTNADEKEFLRVLKDGLRQGSREPADWPVSIAEDFDDLSETDAPRPPAKAEWGAPMMRRDKPVINLTNATLYLGRNLDSILPGLALNLMSGREEWNGGEVDDATVSLARMALERRGLEQVGKEMVGDAINVVARKLQWHPIRDYLNGLTWDGKARLDDWLVRHVGADGSPYVRAVGRKFLMQMVARIMAPGCKVDHTLVLSGPQGLGKSTLCHVLAGDDYFTDSMPSITKGDGIESSRHVAGKWLVELAELAPSRKSEAEDLKAFLSRSTDRVRRPWDKRDAPYPRQCVFVGTTNEEQFLQDATGGRRFWPVTVTKRIDTAALSAERSQLFAEAVAAHRAGEPWHLDPAFEAEHARPVQEAARVSDSWAEKVAAWLAMGEDDDFREDGEAVVPRTEVRLSDVLQDALAISPAQHSRANQNRVAAIMRDLGWTKSKTRTGSVWRGLGWQEVGE